MSAPVDSVELGRLFRRGFAATFGLDLLTKIVAAATVVLLIRGLSVASYAYTTLFLTVAQFAATAASGGVRTRYIREEAERVSRARRETPRGAFLESWVKGTLLVFGVGVFAAPIAWAIGSGSTLGRTSGFIPCAAAFAAGYFAGDLAIGHYQARRQFFRAGVLGVVRAAALLAASLAVILTRESPLLIGLWFMSSMVVVGLVTAMPIARMGVLALTGMRHLFRFSHEEVWLSLYYVASAGFAYVDVMVAAALLSKHEVATLGASLRYLAIVLGAIPALGAVLRVRTAQTDLVDSPVNQRAMIIRWFRRTTLPTGILVASAVVLAPVLLPIIDGGRYPGSVRVLQILLVTAFTAYLTAPAANVLMAQRRYAVLAFIYSVGLLLNLVGDIIVARPFGVVGIAVVSATIYVAVELAMVCLSLARPSAPAS